MTSYHDLEDQTYRSVIAEKITRIYGPPTWRVKEIFKAELTKIAMKHKVSYGWSGGKGLIALIIGATRLAADYPALDPFFEPTIPPNSPTLPARPTPEQIRDAKAANDLLKRDWAVVAGFRRGVGELIREALDSEYYDDLEHGRFGYDQVTPRQYIEHLEDEHCPLDEQAKKQAREHYFRGWERNKTPRPEGLKKFGKRLDEEQEALGLDGITISNADKQEHYLVQIYQSGVYPTTTIRDWKKKPSADQTYANAKTYFQEETRGLTEVQRLMGDNAPNLGFESSLAAIEKGLDGVFERFNEAVDQRIKDAVDEGIERITKAARPTDHANAASEKNINELRQQINDLTNALASVQKELKALVVTGQQNGGGANTDGKPYSDRSGGDKNLVWKNGLKLNRNWGKQKRDWWHKTIKEKEPERWKAHLKELYQKRLDKLNE